MEPESVMLGLTCFTLMSMLLTLAAAAFIFTRFWSRSKARRSFQKQAAADFFVTARNAGSSWLLVCAWYTAGGGAWVVPVLGIYGYYYGVLGMLWYSFMNGCVPTVTAVVSIFAFRIIPRSEPSLPASIRTRFGVALEMQTLMLMLFTEFVTLTSEYMAVSLLLKEVLGLEQYVTLTLYGCFSAFYTICGGALVGALLPPINCLRWPCGFPQLAATDVVLGPPMALSANYLVSPAACSSQQLPLTPYCCLLIQP
jgi:hypothetical protein